MPLLQKPITPKPDIKLPAQKPKEPTKVIHSFPCGWMGEENRLYQEDNAMCCPQCHRYVVFSPFNPYYPLFSLETTLRPVYRMTPDATGSP